MESSVVAPFSSNPMDSVNLMSVKVMHDCTYFGDFLIIFLFDYTASLELPTDNVVHVLQHIILHFKVAKWSIWY